MWRLMHSQDHLVVLVVAFSVFIPTYCTNVRIIGNTRPPVVNVGALFAHNSTIGRVAKTAIELAVEDVNSDKSLLNGTKLVLTQVDSHCNVFVGTGEALELMKKDVVAIIGPQYSDLAHVVSHIANGLQIPLLSFAATDPTLTSYEYPYFIRMTYNDVSQMEAIADFVDSYGWKEVVAVYMDDDHGRNGISALGDALADVGAKINKVAMTPRDGRSQMRNVLVNLASMDTRVFVVHMYSDAGLKLFSEAKDIGMLSTGYVWIATDWLSSVLDSGLLEEDIMNSLQGLMTLRPHTRNSRQRRVFGQRWKNLQTDNMVNVSLNAFGLYAYDSILMIAHSINAFLKQGGNISFAEQSSLTSWSGGKSELAALKVFEGGAQLQNIILQTNFNGIAGPVHLDKNRNLMSSTFEIINVAGKVFRSIGFWSKRTGLSVTPPENTAAISDNQFHIKPTVSNIIWPGESKSVPRGWVHGNELVIVVPRKTGFKEFVTTVKGSNRVKGYCIDVFVAAARLLPYKLRYTFRPYGTGISTPKYDDLVEQVALQFFIAELLQKYDAVIGDILIVKNRSKIVDFTQPYVETGLVVVVQAKEIDSNAWAFMRPFSAGMWCTTGAFFLIMGAVVWIVEHRINPEFRGPPQRQVSNVLWFAFSTTFFSHKQNTKSTLGRIVLLIWLFVVLIITQSYTASLTSILTAQRFSTTIHGIDSLISSNLPIGYQTGSYVHKYLSETLNIAKSRLVPLDSPERYASALSQGPNKGGVSAVVDELPYIQSFLSEQCGFTIVGEEFSKSGWGFAFPKDSPLATDMSTAILTLAENGELQRIHDKWLKNNTCDTKSSQVDSSRFGLNSFWGLFLVLGIVCFIALLVFFCRILLVVCISMEDPNHSLARSLISRSARILKSFASFNGERKEGEREYRLEKKQPEEKMDMYQPESLPSTIISSVD